MSRLSASDATRMAAGLSVVAQSVAEAYVAPLRRLARDTMRSSGSFPCDLAKGLSGTDRPGTPGAEAAGHTESGRSVKSENDGGVHAAAGDVAELFGMMGAAGPEATGAKGENQMATAAAAGETVGAADTAAFDATASASHPAVPKGPPSTPHSSAAPGTANPTHDALHGTPTTSHRTTVVAQKQRQRKEQSVPSSSLSRFLGFAALGANLAAGTVAESFRRTAGFGSNNSNSEAHNKSLASAFLTERNADVLAKSLCRMRGAALKIGQMLSIQDEAIIPPNIAKALDSVRQGADMMPKKQLMKRLSSELGPDWRSAFSEFDETAVASASIGQVHRGVLQNGEAVAMKIQYPGVAESIDSDLANLRRLITYANVLPRGLYVENLMEVAKEELTLECDYELEARNQNKFRELLVDEPDFHVPKVYPEFTTSRIITTEFVHGLAIDRAAELPQETRNWIGRRLLRLCIRELFEFRFMQTDPNFGNFLFDVDSRKINLIDFGAAREYDKGFVDDYLQVVWSASNKDKDTLLDASRRLGFLTEDDSKTMLEAHAAAGLVVGEPFATDGVFDFGKNDITRRLSDLGTVMLKHRLTPPPPEAYSLHRKLSGAFLICIKLRAAFPCRDILEDLVDKYQFGPLPEGGPAVKW